MAEDTRSAAYSRRSQRADTRPPTSKPHALEVEVRHTGCPRIRVTLTGKLDVDSAAQARRVFANAVAAGYTEIEVDVSALASYDVTALVVFESAQVECAQNGGLLLLCNPPPALRGVLESTGLAQLLDHWRS